MLENKEIVVDSEVENNEVEVNKSFAINDFNSKNEVAHENGPVKKSTVILSLIVVVLVIIGLGAMYTINKIIMIKKFYFLYTVLTGDSAMEVQKIKNQDLLFIRGDAIENTPMNSDQYSLLFYDIAYFENDEYLILVIVLIPLQLNLLHRII